jgi:hypothetical protein
MARGNHTHQILPQSTLNTKHNGTETLVICNVTRSDGLSLVMRLAFSKEDSFHA